jgi:hypothetical protein
MLEEKIFLKSYSDFYLWNIISLFLLIFTDKKFSSINTERITSKNQEIKKLGIIPSLFP